MATSSIVHDHFVLLLKTEEFESLPKWLTDNFNVIEGGTHAGGSSRNKLIVFKDGTYLELFNWIKEPVEFKDWENKSPGLIDFALTTMPPINAEQCIEDVQKRIANLPSESDLGVSYTNPLAGGRKRGDGTDVKWKGSRPQFRQTTVTPDQAYFPAGRIDVPFFCHDITDRTVRVAFDDEAKTTHPCGATGVDHVQVAVPQSHLDAYLKLYGAILDCPNADWSEGELRGKEAYFAVGVPHPVDPKPVYVTIFPVGEDEGFFLKERGVGIRTLVLRAAQANADETFALAEDGIGLTVKVRGGHAQ